MTTVIWKYSGEFFVFLFSLNMLIFLVGWGCLTPYLRVWFKEKNKEY